MPLVVVPMSVPIRVIELHEASSPLHKSTGHQAALAETVCLTLPDSVELAGGLCFPGKVDGLGGMGLHPVSKLVGLDPGRQL